MNDTNFTITATSTTSGTFYVNNYDTSYYIKNSIETMKSKFAILADKFLEKYRDEIV